MCNFHSFFRKLLRTTDQPTEGQTNRHINQPTDGHVGYTSKYMSLFGKRHISGREVLDLRKAFGYAYVQNPVVGLACRGQQNVL